MGIRFKIWLTFMVCVGLMTGVSLYVLQQRMTQSFESIEQRDMAAHMSRVHQAMEARLDALNTTTLDWAGWVGLNQYALAPSAEWARDNLGPQAMAPADLSLLLVYDQQAQLLTQSTRAFDGAPGVIPALESPDYGDFLRSRTGTTGCGLVPTNVGLMLTCWAPLQVNGNAPLAGTVVLGRLMDHGLLKKMSQRVHLPFDVMVTTTLPEGLTRWATDQHSGTLGGTHLYAQADASIFHLYYPLHSVLERPVGVISLDVSRELHLQSRQLLKQVGLEQIAAAAVMALLLLVGLHVVLVRRLKDFASQLGTLADQATWSTRIDLPGRDELSVVAARVNTLLTLIQSQVGELNTLSLTDPMTTLANRRAFDAALDRELARAQRQGHPLSVLMIDVDHFKAYNDHYGHPQGDEALKALAQVLNSSVRLHPDLVARLGGEEFCILLPDTPVAGALQTAQRVHANLAARALPHADSPVAPLLTVSVGVTQAQDGETANTLLLRADQALYAAKAQGRNRTHCIF